MSRAARIAGGAEVLLSRTFLPVLALTALAASVAPRPARAHGVVAEVDREGGAVAVRLRYHGGRPLADARFEVLSPRGGEAPFAEGRTDRHGWVAFTPDVAGKWTVRIADASGHGKTVEVEVGEVVAPIPSPVAAVSPPLPPQTANAPPEESPTVFRVLAGAAAIVAVFGAVFAVQRARRRKAG